MIGMDRNVFVTFRDRGR